MATAVPMLIPPIMSMSSVAPLERDPAVAKTAPQLDVTTDTALNVAATTETSPQLDVSAVSPSLEAAEAPPPQVTLAMVESGLDDDGWDPTPAFGITPCLPVFKDGPLCIPEVSELRTGLLASPHEFEMWMQFIGLVENGGSTEQTKAVYLAFLDEFPLCWGFWKRLAILEASEHGPKQALATYEQALATGACACVELWVNYAAAARTVAAAPWAALTADEVRSVFERGLDAVGDDWHAGPLWQAYLDFEEESKDWGRLGALFRRALKAPIEALAALRVRLRALIVGDACPPLGELCPTEEVAELCRLKALDSETAEAACAEAQTEKSDADLPSQRMETSTSEQRPAAEQPSGCEDRELEEQRGEQPSVRREPLGGEDGELEEPSGCEDGELEEPSEPICSASKPASVATDPSVEAATHLTQSLGAPSTKAPVGVPLDEDDLSDGEISCEEGELLEETPEVPEEALKPPGSSPQRRSRDAGRGQKLTFQSPSGWLMQQWELGEEHRRFLEAHEVLFKQTLLEADKRREFEVFLQRPYFHERPLSAIQLSVWHRYLEWEEARQPCDRRRRELLHKRCLVAANNYMEFWLRYAEVLEAEEGQENACKFIADACLSGRLRQRPEALVAWAELEEQCGRLDRARRILDGTLAAGSSVEVVLRRVAMERRAGNLELCEAILRKHMDESSGLGSRAILTQHYGRFCEDILKRPDMAARAYERAWHAGCRDVCLLTEYVSLLFRVDLGETSGMAALNKTIKLFEDSLDPSTTTYTTNEACAVWSRYVDFMVAKGAPLMQLKSVQERARALQVPQRAGGHGCKRPATEVAPNDGSNVKAPRLSEPQLLPVLA
mmetsp:Transcript_4307/g.7585  ORF Transcript_4307/g.7585 Transcript_4307/m.7585 type:complete len:844 (-) Transcript_4307:86-2617(-)